MKFSHKVEVDAAPDKLWAFLRNFERAGKCLPGVKELKKIDDTHYEGLLEAGVGPVKINLKGNCTLGIDEANKTNTMTAEAHDARVGGGVKAIMTMKLLPLGATKSELQMDSDITLMGRLGDMGMPIIKMRANSTVKEFAENLAKELKK